MKVKSASRARSLHKRCDGASGRISRRARPHTIPIRNSGTGREVEVSESRFPAAERWQGDAAILRCASSRFLHQCGLCDARLPRVQVNDVIGMAYRSHESKIVFDFDDPMANQPAWPAANVCGLSRAAR